MSHEFGFIFAGLLAVCLPHFGYAVAADFLHGDPAKPNQASGPTILFVSLPVLAFGLSKGMHDLNGHAAISPVWRSPTPLALWMLAAVAAVAVLDHFARHRFPGRRQVIAARALSGAFSPGIIGWLAIGLDREVDRSVLSSRLRLSNPRRRQNRRFRPRAPFARRVSSRLGAQRSGRARGDDVGADRAGTGEFRLDGISFDLGGGLEGRLTGDHRAG
ncbi:MAG: hypothetical protein R3F11_08865 [Verrucomicrobiales bacterium]